MNKISFKPAAHAPGVFAVVPVKSRQGDRTRAMTHSRKALITAEGNTPALVVSTKANPGLDVIAFSQSSIWDAAKDLAGRAWDANNSVLTDEGGGGGSGGVAREAVSSDEAKIGITNPAPALLRPQFSKPRIGCI